MNKEETKRGPGVMTIQKVTDVLEPAWQSTNQISMRARLSYSVTRIVLKHLKNVGLAEELYLKGSRLFRKIIVIDPMREWPEETVPCVIEQQKEIEEIKDRITSLEKKVSAMKSLTGDLI